MGGITLNNYVASYGEEVALDVSVSISGGLSCTTQKDFQRSSFTWQPLLAGFTKKYFLEQKWGQRLYHKLGRDGYQGLMRASSVAVRLLLLVHKCITSLDSRSSSINSFVV